MSDSVQQEASIHGLPYVHHSFISGVCDSTLFIPQSGGLSVVVNSRELTLEVHRAFATSSSEFEQLRILNSAIITSSTTTKLRSLSIKGAIVDYFSQLGINCEYIKPSLTAKSGTEVANEQELERSDSVGKSHGILADNFVIESVVFNWPSYVILGIKDPNGNIHLLLLRLPSVFLSLVNGDRCYSESEYVSQIRSLAKRQNAEFDPMEDFSPNFNGNASTPYNLPLDRSIVLTSSVMIRTSDEYILASSSNGTTGLTICTNPGNIHLHNLSIVNLRADSCNRRFNMAGLEDADISPVLMGCIEYVNTSDTISSSSCGGFVFSWNPIEPMIRKLIIFAEPPKSLQKNIKKIGEMKNAPGIFYHADKNQFYVSPYLSKNHGKRRERPTAFTYGDFELMTSASHKTAFVGTSCSRVIVLDIYYLLNGIDDLSSSIVCALTINSSTFIRKDGKSDSSKTLYDGAVRKLVVNRDGVFALVQTKEMMLSIDSVMNPDSVDNCDVFAFWSSNSLIPLTSAARLEKKEHNVTTIANETEESEEEKDVELKVKEKEIEDNQEKEEEAEEKDDKEQEKKEKDKIITLLKKDKIVKHKRTTTTIKTMTTAFKLRYKCVKVAIYIPKSSMITTSYPKDSVMEKNVIFYTIPSVPSTIARHTLEDETMCCISSVSMPKVVAAAEANIRQSTEYSTQSESIGNSNPCQGILLGFTNGDVAFCSIRFPSEATAELAAASIPILTLDWYGKDVISTRVYGLAGSEVGIILDDTNDSGTIANNIGASKSIASTVYIPDNDSDDEETTSQNNTNVSSVAANSTQRVSRGKLAEKKGEAIAVRIQVASKNTLVVFSLPPRAYSGIASGSLETKVVEANIAFLNDKKALKQSQQVNASKPLQQSNTASPMPPVSPMTNLRPHFGQFGQQQPYGMASSQGAASSQFMGQNATTSATLAKRLKLLSALRQTMAQWSEKFPTVLQSLCLTPEHRRIVTAHLAKYLTNKSVDTKKTFNQYEEEAKKLDDPRSRFVESLGDFINDIYRIIRVYYLPYPVLDFKKCVELIRQNGDEEVVERIEKMIKDKEENQAKRDAVAAKVESDDAAKIAEEVEKKVGWTEEELTKETNICDDLLMLGYLISSSNIIPLNFGAKQAARIATAMTNNENTIEIQNVMNNLNEDMLMNSDLMKSAMEIECEAYPISQDVVYSMPGLSAFIYHLRNIVSKTFEALNLNEDCMQPAVNDLKRQVDHLGNLLYGASLNEEEKAADVTKNEEESKEIERNIAVNVPQSALYLFDLFEKKGTIPFVDHGLISSECTKCQKIVENKKIETKLYEKIVKASLSPEETEKYILLNNENEQEEILEVSSDESEEEIPIDVKTQESETVVYDFIDGKNQPSTTSSTEKKESIVSRVSKYLRNLRLTAEKICIDKFNKMMIKVDSDDADEKEDDSFEYFVSSCDDGSVSENIYETDESEEEPEHEELAESNNESTEEKKKQKKLAKTIHKKYINYSQDFVAETIDEVIYEVDKLPEDKTDDKDKKNSNLPDIGNLLEMYKNYASQAASTYTSLRIVTAQKLTSAMKNTEAVLMNQFLASLPRELVIADRFVFLPYVNKLSVFNNVASRHYLMEATSSGIAKIQMHMAKLATSSNDLIEKEKQIVAKEQQLKAGSIQYQQISAAMSKIRETGNPNDQEVLKQYQALNQRLQYLQSGLKKIQSELANDQMTINFERQNSLRTHIKTFGVDVGAEVSANSNLVHLNQPGQFVDVLDLTNVNSSVCTSVSVKVYPGDMPSQEGSVKQDITREAFEMQTKMLGYQAIMMINTLANLDPMNRFLKPATTTVVKVPTFAAEPAPVDETSSRNILKRIGAKTSLVGPLAYSTVVFFDTPAEVVRLDTVLACLQYGALPEVKKYLEENESANEIVSRFSKYFTKEKNICKFTHSILEILYIVQYFYANLNQNMGGNFIYGLNYLRPSTLYLRIDKDPENADEKIFVPVIAHPGMLSTAVPSFNDVVEFDGVWCAPESLMGIVSVDNKMKGDMWSVSLLIVSILLAACGHFDSCPVNIENAWVESEKINKARYDFMRRNNPNVDQIFKPNGSEIFADVDFKLIGTLTQSGAAAANKIVGGRRLSAAIRACAKAAMDINNSLTFTEDDLRALVFYNQPTHVVSPNSSLKDLEYIKTIFSTGSLSSDIAGHVAARILFQSLSNALTCDPSSGAANQTLFSQNAILAAASKHPSAKALFVGFSVEARDFLGRCLNFSQDKRLSFEEALTHQWFMKEQGQKGAEDSKPVALNTETKTQKKENFQLDENAEKVNV